MKPVTRDIRLHLVESEDPRIKETLAMIPQLGIRAIGERGAGNANTLYKILDSNGDQVTGIGFQTAPIPEVGINGATNEALLAIVADRLEGFQSGPCPCAENAAALDFVKSALDTLHARTVRRLTEGTEGQNVENSPDRPVEQIVDTSKAVPQQDPPTGPGTPDRTITVPPTEPQES